MKKNNTMKNEDDLNKKITDITMLIQTKHPELSIYISEMPATIPTNKSVEINIETLSSYYNSLETMLSKYELELNPKKPVIK